jgi:hypothetical protein
MATIQRPTKEGSVRTYQEKVGLGYVDILASEMDADLDTIYAAWNGGADAINIKDGSITTAKLADIAVTAPKLAVGAVGGGQLADGAVTTAKLAVGASVKQIVKALLPANVLSNATAWTDLVYLSITTRGGPVLLLVSAGWGIKGNANTDNGASVQFLRDPGATVVFAVIHTFNVASGGLGRVPLPALIAVDQPAAGTYTYHVQRAVLQATSYFLTDPSWGAGAFWAVEFA